MTRLKEILEQGLEACCKYEEDQTVQLEMAKITLKRLENEIIRSGVGIASNDSGKQSVSVSKEQLLKL